MKLELESRRQEQQVQQQVQQEGAPGPTWPPPQPPETQDFQEYLAENERAVLHLQTAEHLERLKAEEDSGSGSGAEGGGLCVLGEHLDDTWQVKPAPCAGLASAVLIPLEPAVLCYPPGQPAQVSSQPYLPDSPALYCPAKGGSGHLEHPAAACSPPGKELGVSPVPAAVGEAGAAHLEPPHLPV
ncbi:CSRN2 protein, partial [Sitta europaea]|nr:CSRN2 protein [Sitta europaea]